MGKLRSKNALKIHYLFKEVINDYEKIGYNLKNYVNFNSVKHLCFLKEHDFAIKFILYLESNMNLSSDLKFINSSKEHLFCNLNDHKIFLKKELIEIAYNYTYYEPLYKLSEFLIINHLDEISDFLKNYENETRFIYILGKCLHEKIKKKEISFNFENFFLDSLYDNIFDYSILYAYKYYLCENESELNIKIVDKLIRNGPYDIIPIVSVLIYHSVKNKFTYKKIKSRSFWEPIWDYNKEEINELKAILHLKNINIETDTHKSNESIPVYKKQEIILKNLKKEKNQLYKYLGEYYWEFHLNVDILKNNFHRIFNDDRFECWLYLFFTSYHWEVINIVSEYTSNYLEINDSLENVFNKWLEDKSHPANYGMLHTFYFYYKKTNNLEKLKIISKVCQSSDNAQLRGSVLEIIYEQIINTSMYTLKTTFKTWQNEIFVGINDNDIWSIHISVLILRYLKENGVNTSKIKVYEKSIFHDFENYLDLDKEFDEKSFIINLSKKKKCMM